MAIKDRASQRSALKRAEKKLGLDAPGVQYVHVTSSHDDPVPNGASMILITGVPEASPAQIVQAQLEASQQRIEAPTPEHLTPEAARLEELSRVRADLFAAQSETFERQIAAYEKAEAQRRARGEGSPPPFVTPEPADAA